jgi:hypothetical protein
VVRRENDEIVLDSTRAGNLSVLCGGCHARVHDGTLLIRGTAPDGLTFLHGDGRPFGAPPPEPARPAAQVCEDAVSALVHLSFPKARARAAVSAAAAHVG